MILNLAEQVQSHLGKSELVIITERVDDVALLLAQMINMGLAEMLDLHLPKLPKPWQQERLSWGSTNVAVTEGHVRAIPALLHFGAT
jgi:hypothetical protein